MTNLPVSAKPPALPASPRRIQLRRGDHEFLPAALEILETPLSPVRGAMILTICAFAAIALAWCYFGRVDIIASAQGKIQPVGRTKTIQPLETGKVAAIAVENGQHVKAGDVLLTLDPGESRADEGTIRADLESEKAEALRRVTALALAAKRALGAVPSIAFGAGTPVEIAAREQRVLAGDIGQLASAVGSLEGQKQEKIAERDRLKSTIAAQETLVGTLQQRVSMRSELLAKAAESKAKVIDALELMQTQAATLASEKGQLGEIDARSRADRRRHPEGLCEFHGRERPKTRRRATPPRREHRKARQGAFQDRRPDAEEPYRRRRPGLDRDLARAGSERR